MTFNSMIEAATERGVDARALRRRRGDGKSQRWRITPLVKAAMEEKSFDETDLVPIIRFVLERNGFTSEGWDAMSDDEVERMLSCANSVKQSLRHFRKYGSLRA